MNLIRYLYFIALIPCLVFGADIHKWGDADGKIHFGDNPPADTQTELITVRPNVYASPSIEDLSAIFGHEENSHGETVVMYGTAWCGYCKKARSYFVANNILYEEYDVEKSEKGKRDYKKLGAKGVPVILVGEKRLNGFSEAAFERIYMPE